MEEALQQMRQDLNQLTTLVKASLSNATNGNDGASLFLPFLSVCLSVCLSVRLSICLSVCLSVFGGCKGQGTVF